MSFEACFRMHSLMSDFNRPWYIAGGWAVDLYLGYVSREHGDIEILVYREDQTFLKEYFKKWHMDKVVDRELKPWGGEFLDLPVHELHASNKQSGDKFEILLNETEGLDWVYRRDLRVKMPLMEAGSLTARGLPYLNPLIVLLYKSKYIRPKDQQDFLIIYNKLSRKQKDWLSNALVLQDPEHMWLEKLKK
ncbi:hypothetical protein J7I80_09495 [Bacillus sp. ISL-41]|uniref:nucleotidyltransferase domain-containing protein n=1 Tax=Bacillus sp. ISL-41 TaxID=2819127 RepID=UPI001BE6033A|nr:hypothetical protein [Bacillus sp. ISL-41]MBT2642460.1 hypothetical protein [Bacillus sp. ISL-41]